MFDSERTNQSVRELESFEFPVISSEITDPSQMFDVFLGGCCSWRSLLMISLAILPQIWSQQSRCNQLGLAPHLYVWGVVVKILNNWSPNWSPKNKTHQIFLVGENTFCSSLGMFLQFAIWILVVYLMVFPLPAGELTTLKMVSF